MVATRRSKQKSTTTSTAKNKNKKKQTRKNNKANPVDSNPEIENSSDEVSNDDSDHQSDIDPTPVPTRRNSSKRRTIKRLQSTPEVDSTIQGSKTILDMRTAIKIVPDFNGSPDCVDEFVRSCRMANAAIAPDMKLFFIGMIRKKCIENANRYISGQGSYANLNAMLNDLKRNFGSKDNYEQLLGEFVRLYQKQGESVREFGMRISTDLKRLLESIDRTYDSDDALGVARGARNTAKSCFLAGLLNPEITSRIEMQHPKDLDDAIEKGREAEQTVNYRLGIRTQSNDGESKIDYQYREGKLQLPKRKLSPEPVAHAQIHDTQQTNPNQRRETRSCFHCKKPGHLKFQCNQLKNERNNYKNQNKGNWQRRNYTNNDNSEVTQQSHNKTRDLNSNETRLKGPNSSQQNQKGPSTFVCSMTPEEINK